ncbi:hypothetical protein, partial [Microvirga alba]|uniref:hypothetical protein n=1 Tax=Microvirga alba TaxID=2791025 RepID=UPI001AEE8D16
SESVGKFKMPPGRFVVNDKPTAPHAHSHLPLRCGNLANNENKEQAQNQGGDVATSRLRRSR